MTTVLAHPAFSNRKANPYNWTIYSSLESLGVRVVELTPANLITAQWDVFHFHWPFSWATNPRWLHAWAERRLFAAALAKTRMTGAKLIWTAHNILPHDFRTSAGYLRYMSRLLPHVDGIIVMNDATTEQLSRTFLVPDTVLHAKVHYIPHPTFDVLKNIAAHQNTPGNPEKYVLIPGAIRPYKGLEAVANIAEHAPDLRFVIAGRVLDAHYSRHLQDIFASIRNITFQPGYLDDAQLATFVQSASCVFLPYRRINNSGAAILAATFGVPVLISASPASAEISRYLPPGYTDSFEETDSENVIIGKLRKMMLLRKLGDEELDVLQAAYKPLRVARMHKDLYRRLIEPASQT